MRAVPRIPTPPLALAVGVAAVACFGIALLIGWLTAGTKEQLRRATVVHPAAVAQAIPAFGAAVPLPPAPRRRRAASAQPLPVVPKVIVGSG